MFIETSARTGYNVKRMFLRLASALPPSGNIFDLDREILNTKDKNVKDSSVVLKSTECEPQADSEQNKRKSFCAC